MNFRRHCEISEDLTEQALQLLEMKNTNDLEKELNSTRSTIRKITVRALGKMYKALEQSNPGLSPVEIVLAIISFLQANGDGSFEEVAKVVVRELPNDAKQAFITAFKEKFPNADYSKFGIK